MAREPQRSTEPRPLDAKLVPLERALLTRAKVLEAQAQALMDDDLRTPASETGAGIRRIFASEHRALAEELKYW